LLDKNDQAEGDICARFTVWWNHNRGRFTTTRQAAYAAFMAEAQAAPQPDSNELVEALKQNVRAFRNKDTGDIEYVLMGELPDNWEDVLIIPNISNEVIDSTLAQSPSVGLNAKKGGK
jgi:hypothetical protein